MLRGAQPVPTAETRPPGSSHSASPFLRVPSARSGRVPRQSLDAPDNLPKQALRQVALHKLEDEVPGMSDAAPPVFQPCRAASSKASEHRVLEAMSLLPALRGLLLWTIQGRWAVPPKLGRAVLNLGAETMAHSRAVDRDPRRAALRASGPRDGRAGVRPRPGSLEKGEPS